VLRSLLASTFMSFLAFSAMWSTVGLWGEAEFGWGPREIGLAMALTGVSARSARGWCRGAVVRRIGEPTTVAVGLLLTAAALGLQAAAPLAAIAVACMVAAVAGHALSQPAMSSLISRRRRRTGRGRRWGATRRRARWRGFAGR
jgi:predicted MFS family arabinose efflux permease